MAGPTITPYPDEPPIGFNPAWRGGGPSIPIRLPWGGVGPIPTTTVGGGTVPDANVVNSVATPIRDVQAQVVAENAPLRLVYGRAAIGAQIADVLAYNGNLIIFVIWGQGPWNQIETVLLDAKAPGTGVNVVSYTGSQVAADPTLVAAYAANGITYGDILPGIAYSMISMPPGSVTGFPTFTAVVQGLKIYDPRDGTQTLGVPATYKYSECPALAVGDIQTNTTYGAGGAVDWASVTTTANANDALVGGTEKRRTIGLVIDNMQPLTSWLEALRVYAGCFLARNGSTLVLVPDRPASSSYTFSESATGATGCRVKNVKRRSRRDVPTVSAIRYTDTSAYPWRDAFAYAYAAGVLAGTVPWKLHEVALPGCTRPTQATREAIEQLNKLSLTDLTWDVEGQDESLSVVVGDVVTTTAHVGLAARPGRVINVTTPTLGRPIFNLEGYDPAVYSDSVVAGPTIVDTALPNPAALPSPVAPLVITETPYLEQVNGSALAGGLIYQSRFDCTWTAPSSAFPVTYRVEVWDGGLRIRDEQVSSPAYSTPTLQQGKSYTVKVYSRNTVTENVTPLTGTKLVAGNTIPPGAVTIVSGRELGGDVLLECTQSASVDTVRYEWRYFPNGTGSWATATFIDRVDVLRPRFKGLPIGTHRFYVRPVNSVGLYSLADAFVDIPVTSDANAFIQSRTFTSPTLTNMVAVYTAEDGLNTPRWATSVAGQTWNASITGPVNAVATPVIVQHLAGTQKWQGESWDLGSTVTGDWTFTANVFDITGAATYALETSPDGSTWTAQPGITWKGATRFIRPAINNLTTGTMAVLSPPKIDLAALSKTESAKVTTLASGGLLVALANRYSGAQDLQATAINTSSPRIMTADRILLHPQAGLMLTADTTAGDASVSQNISALTGYVLVAGDTLEYDVFIDPASPAATTLSDGGAQLVFSDASNSAGIAAADGFNSAQPATGFDALARGMWVGRKVLLTTKAGLQITAWRIRLDSDGVGTHKVLFRNIRVTDGGATVRATAWSAGEPTVNTTQSSALATNIRCGPSNTFLLYAFTDAGAQVAQDAQYSFRGF